MTGRPGDDLDWQAGYEARTGRTLQEDWVPAVNSIRRLAGSGRAPGSRVIAFATWLLALLGGGLMYVSFDAQYQFILAQKGARAASLIEAAMLDAGVVILSALGIGLARAGKPSASVRVLIAICAGASAGMNFAAANPASWRSVVAYVPAPVFLAVITDRVIAVIRQHVLPLDTESAWAPLGRATVTVLRLAGIVALYLLRTALAPARTFRGLRQMVLDAAPVPGMTGDRRVCGERFPCPAHDHGIPEYGFERPSEDKCAAEVSAGTVCGEPLPCAVHQGFPVFPPGVAFASHGGTIPRLTLNPDGQPGICNGHPGEAGDRGAGQPVVEFRTKKAAFLSRYRGHPEYGNRSAAGGPTGL